MKFDIKVNNQCENMKTCTLILRVGTAISEHVVHWGSRHSVTHSIHLVPLFYLWQFLSEKVKHHRVLVCSEHFLQFVITCRNFWDVGHGDEFLGLTSTKLVEFISSDELQVEREEIVFQAVMRWFNHNPEQRRADFHKVCLLKIQLIL